MKITHNIKPEYVAAALQILPTKKQGKDYYRDADTDCYCINGILAEAYKVVHGLERYEVRNYVYLEGNKTVYIPFEEMTIRLEGSPFPALPTVKARKDGNTFQRTFVCLNDSHDWTFKDFADLFEGKELRDECKRAFGPFL